MVTVIGDDPALDEFADIYVAADPAERTPMAAGVDALNRRLALRPTTEGESRTGGLRIAFPALLVVFFEVELLTDTVRVGSVERYGR